ncbi:MAG: spore coat protein U domain-containing protein [Bryobacteraceae bacterium]
MMLRFLFIATIVVSGVASAATCTVSGSAAFGSYDPLTGEQILSTGTVAVTCTGTTGEDVSYAVSLSPGNGSFSDRTMLSSGHTMHYNLYRDAGCLQVWGDGTSSTYTLTDSMTLTSTSTTKYYTVYGRITSSQHQLQAGTYTDNITLTVDY